MADSPSGGGAAARGDGGDGAAIPQSSRIYERLAAVREERLCKEAQLERQAAKLTRGLLRRRERELEERLREDAERSRAQHELILRRKAEEAHEKEAEGAVAKELSKQIYSLMREKTRERSEEEQRKQAALAESKRWVQARSIAERMHLEERLHKRDQLTKDKGEKWQEMLARNAEAKEEQDALDREEMAARQEREKVAKEKAQKSRETQRKEQIDRMREVRKDLAKKQHEVEERKRQKHEERCQGFTEKSQKWQEKRANHQRAEVAETEARNARILGRKAASARDAGHAVAAESMPLEAFSAGPASESTPRGAAAGGGGASRAGGATRAGSEAAARPAHGEEENEPAKEKPATATPYWSLELGQAHTRIKKEYVQRVHDVEAAKEKAFLTKKFKSLAENAKDDDEASKRLESLEKVFFSKTPRENKAAAAAAAAADRAASTYPTGSPSARRVKQCGLCGREFLAEGLPGSASRRAVERVKACAPVATPRGAGAAGAAAPSALAAARSQAAKYYEEPVRLCESCWHKVRIHPA